MKAQNLIVNSSSRESHKIGSIGTSRPQNLGPQIAIGYSLANHYPGPRFIPEPKEKEHVAIIALAEDIISYDLIWKQNKI